MIVTYSLVLYIFIGVRYRKGEISLSLFLTLLFTSNCGHSHVCMCYVFVSCCPLLYKAKSCNIRMNVTLNDKTTNNIEESSFFCLFVTYFLSCMK